MSLSAARLAVAAGMLACLQSGSPSYAAASQAQGGERVTIQRQGPLFFANLSLPAATVGRARVVLRLYGLRPYPEARWQPLRRWSLVRTLRATGRYPPRRGAARQELRVRARNVLRICRAFAACRLRATATVWVGGKRLTPRPARRAVATGLWQPDLAAARRYARGRPGDVSFAIVDLRSRLRGFRMPRTAPAASTIKATLLATYLRQRSVRGRPLRAEERALLEPMIRVSDNGAAATVATVLGGAKVERFGRRVAGMRDFRWIGSRGYIGGNSRISARDEARFFHRFNRYVPDRHRRYARRLLASIVSWQRWGIADARPPGWRLYFKGGWGINDDGVGTVNHQVAFLEHGRCRIALAILTEHNPSTTDGAETQRGIATRLLRGIRSAPCG